MLVVAGAVGAKVVRQVTLKIKLTVQKLTLYFVLVVAGAAGAKVVRKLTLKKRSKTSQCIMYSYLLGHMAALQTKEESRKRRNIN